jgi:hypothetical protein
MPSHRRQVLLLTAASVLISARDVQALLKAVAGWARRKSAFAYPTALAFGRYDENHHLRGANGVHELRHLVLQPIALG